MLNNRSCNCAREKPVSVSASRASASRVLSALLASTALTYGGVTGLALASAASTILVVASTATTLAANGGNGGASGFTTGGAGGIGDGAAGSDGQVNADGLAGSGGGGGASGTVAGGKGGDGTGAGGQPGGAGGTAGDAFGKQGGFSAGGGGGFSGIFAGGGGAGGAGNAVTAVGIDGSNTNVDAGGGGGGGGGGSGEASGGADGGAGGVGGKATISTTSTTTNDTLSGTARGGVGGNGGDAGNHNETGSFSSSGTGGGFGGAGGKGGDAQSDINANGAGSTINTTALAGKGGNGGRGGISFDVTGSNLVAVITTGGSAIGGNGGAGGTGGDAAVFLATGSGSPGGVITALLQAGKGGDGGDGGVGMRFNGSGVSLTNAGTITGGVGGVGGTSGQNATPHVTNNSGPPNQITEAIVAPGVGGVGGVGVLFVGAGSTFTNTGSVIGGAGGHGGNTPAGSFSSGSAAGDAGHGVVFSGGGTIVNSGTITGGAGGDGGLGSGVGLAGRGGIGIVGAGLTINNSGGTINGGLNGNSLGQQAAIQLGGGANFISPGGTINGDIILLGGSLSPALPGSTAGATLTVNGGLSFAPGSTYNIRVNGAANDSITLTGGTAVVTAANVSANLAGNTLGQHTIITAAHITGTFAALTTSGSTSAFLQETLLYDPTHVFLNITGSGANGAIDFTTAAQTASQANVAAALSSAGNANGFSGPLITLIANLSASQARAAFTALDGEAGTGAERASFRFMDEFLNLMLNPFVDGHFGSASGGATGFAPEQQAELPPEMAQAYASVFKAPPPANFEQRWSIWNAAFGGSGKTSGNPIIGSSDTTLSTFGFAGGIDYRFSPYTVVGLAVAGGGTNWGLSNALGTGRSESAQIGAYARTVIGPAYIAESIAFASHWFSTNRSALGDNLHADFTGASFGGRIEGGYRFAVTPNFGFTPYAAAQAQAFHSGAYSENDASNLGFGLSYAAKDATDLRTELGARFDNPTLLNGTPLVIRARLAWAHDFVDTPSLAAAFQALPLSNFTVFGAPIPRDSALASLGADWYLNRGWKLTAKFDGEFATRSDIYAGTVALRYAW